MTLKQPPIRDCFQINYSNNNNIANGIIGKIWEELTKLFALCNGAAQSNNNPLFGWLSRSKQAAYHAIYLIVLKLLIKCPWSENN